MSCRFTVAQAAAATSTLVLRRILRRSAANFPGKIGLAIDPLLIDHLASRVRRGSIVVVGTNGKTSVTNMIADAFEHAGASVICNRTGANLDSGVATALLHARTAEWGIFESDELWLARIVPQLKPRFVVLLNLFRDQLDRMGEIEHMQESIARALSTSPETTLLYNCDDPLCQAIAERVDNERLPFGWEDNPELAQNSVADADMCQKCGSSLTYERRIYGQLGSYHCPSCGFSRPEPVYAAQGISFAGGNASFALRACGQRAETSSANYPERRISLEYPGSYLVYNVLAAYAACAACQVPFAAFVEAVEAFDPGNGRLQRYLVDGRHILLNLAKNPTGFNQNLRIIESDAGPKAVAFFINDKEADGHDISWLWDVDFQELASTGNLTVFAGGIRRNDLQVRLKYAGIDAPLVNDARDFLAQARAASSASNLYIIANYTALPQVKGELDRLSHLPAPTAKRQLKEALTPRPIHEKLVIAHLYPELLNLYGDGGNVSVLAHRAMQRGIDVEVLRIRRCEDIDLSRADIVFLGGGPDKEQRLASDELFGWADELRSYVEDDGVMLAICGGYQMLGRSLILDGETVPGLGILDIETRRAEGGSHNRLVGNIALESPLARMPVIGYENHAGRTYLGAGCSPFGTVIGRHGHGNNDIDDADGVRYRNVVGSYVHGPLLGKNPDVADCLIEWALARRAAKEGRPAPILEPLDDTREQAANAFMSHRLGVRHS